MKRSGTLTGTMTSDPYEIPHEAMIHMDGNFGGGTVTVQFLGQDSVWHDFSDDAGKQVYDANATRVLDMIRRRTIRLSAVGVGSVYFDID